MRSTIGDLKQPAKTAVNILNDLLNYEKLDSGLMTLERSIQDPLLFVRETLPPFQLTARTKNIALLVDEAEDFPIEGVRVNIDETKVTADKSVVLDLLSAGIFRWLKCCAICFQMLLNLPLLTVLSA